MALVAQVLEGLKDEFGESSDLFVLDSDLVKLVREQLYEGRHNDRVEKPITLRKIAKSLGWYSSTAQVKVKDWGLRLAPARVVSLNKKFSEMSDGQLVESGLRPFDVLSWAQKKGAL
jgi:hypothetical protein